MRKIATLTFPLFFYIIPPSMRIAFLAVELYPYAKVGGLADVVSSLSKSLASMGEEVWVFLPVYTVEAPQVDEIEVPLLGDMKKVKIRMRKENGVKHYFLDDGELFPRKEVYGGDELLRFSFFVRAACDYVKKLGGCDVYHFHDWHTAFLPLYVKDTPSVFTIHNLAYQGIFPKEDMKKTGIPEENYSPYLVDGNINLMRTGILASTLLNTVSPTYAREITTPEFGAGLHEELKKRGKDLRGILNGIDYEVWNPEKDEHIPANYSVEKPEGKEECRKKLMEETGILHEGPLFGFISRLVEQKGLDILIPAISRLVNMGINLIVLGTGEEKYEKELKRLEQRFKGRLYVKIAFDARFSRRIYAGCDYFLMPSRFEPCGLGQLIAMRYGTIPVGRKTGGLADTITPERGFLFEEYTPEALLSCVKNAVEIYRKEKFYEMRKNCMLSDFSWKKSAEEYLKLYRDAKEVWNGG